MANTTQLYSTISRFSCPINFDTSIIGLHNCHSDNSGWLEMQETCEFRVVENIPKGVVDFLDEMDPGDPGMPPRFQCEKCGGIMSPDSD